MRSNSTGGEVVPNQDVIDLFRAFLRVALMLRDTVA